jgi:transglutaminase-like putative cysteine protease
MWVVMTELHANAPFRWTIRHETTYRYDAQVAFAPHVLRLTPRADSARTIARAFYVTPTPIERHDHLDAFGNTCTRVTFGPETSNELIIDSHLEVETYAAPFRDGSRLPPLPWAPNDSDLLGLYRQRDDSAEVAALAQRLASEVGQSPLMFFELLCRTLYTTLDRKIRFAGNAQSPSETLRTGRGACRDLTVLFLAVCRSLGVAARFVSGYQGQEESPDGKRHLHAWPEVFVPDYGWLGWDPTHGVATGPSHVALSAAPEQAATMPVEGGFYFNGPTVSSTLGYSIAMAAPSV